MSLDDVMLDLETLGTEADSVILSIGAVRFDAYGTKIEDKGFYASVSIDSNLAYGRRIDEQTLIWWLGQSPEAQLVFRENKTTIDAALEELSVWFADTGGIKDAERVRVWSNGADFDIPMLKHAYRQMGWDTPWKFWNQKCYRTVKGMPFAVKAPKPENKLKHNALADAMYQAQHLQAIHKVMDKLKVAA